jgi:hypothetical protein
MKNYGARGIVSFTVVPNELNVIQKFLQVSVLIFFQLVADSA